MDKNIASRAFFGIPCAPGLCMGPVVIKITRGVEVPRREGSDPKGETRRLEEALHAAGIEIEGLKKRTLESIGKDEAAVFDAHLMFLSDPALSSQAATGMQTGLNAEAAWMDGVEYFATQLESIPDPLFSARAMDVRDVGRRVLCHLLGIPTDDGLRLYEPSIVVARDLAPSETVGLDKRFLLGFCLVQGGPSSHTAILARGLGIPAVAGVDESILEISSGAVIIVDGTTGEVVVNPSEVQQTDAARRIREEQVRIGGSKLAAQQPAITRDGDRIEIVANIGGADDAVMALDYGAEGVGLFRTEFLYLNRNTLPTEEEQTSAYQKVFAPLRGLPVVVRTMDIGGDKAVPYLGIAAEPNPFLGWRAIRMIDERADVLQSQLRALLRAGTEVDLRIMFPMVSGVKEVHQLLSMVRQVRTELDQQGIPAAKTVQVGIMVEVPSAALLADHLAPLVDFFSIGTNDLTQYTLAVDRGNQRVAGLASPYNPAVLRLISMTIEAAHRHRKWVGLCGELAGDPLAAVALLGMGLDEFSMAPARIPQVKAKLRTLYRSDSTALARELLSMDSAEAVIDRLKNA